MISEDVGGTIKILVVLHKNFEGGCLAADNSSVKTISKDFLPVDSFGHYSQLVIFYFTAPRPSADILNIDPFHLESVSKV